MHKKRQFKIDPIQQNVPYNALVDKHLEYFFANRKNRQILVRTKVVNRRNEIIDRDLCKMLDHGLVNPNPKFRMKKSKPKISSHDQQYRSMQNKSSLNKTVGKKEFEEFLESQRNLLKTKTIGVRIQNNEPESQKEQEHPQKVETPQS